MELFIWLNIKISPLLNLLNRLYLAILFCSLTACNDSSDFESKVTQSLDSVLAKVLSSSDISLEEKIYIRDLAHIFLETNENVAANTRVSGPNKAELSPFLIRNFPDLEFEKIIRQKAWLTQAIPERAYLLDLYINEILDRDHLDPRSHGCHGEAEILSLLVDVTSSSDRLDFLPIKFKSNLASCLMQIGRSNLLSKLLSGLKVAYLESSEPVEDEIFYFLSESVDEGTLLDLSELRITILREQSESNQQLKPKIPLAMKSTVYSLALKSQNLLDHERIKLLMKSIVFNDDLPIRERADLAATYTILANTRDKAINEFIELHADQARQRLEVMRTDPAQYVGYFDTIWNDLKLEIADISAKSFGHEHTIKNYLSDYEAAISEYFRIYPRRFKVEYADQKSRFAMIPLSGDNSDTRLESAFADMSLFFIVKPFISNPFDFVWNISNTGYFRGRFGLLSDYESVRDHEFAMSLLLQWIEISFAFGSIEENSTWIETASDLSSSKSPDQELDIVNELHYAFLLDGVRESRMDGSISIGLDKPEIFYRYALLNSTHRFNRDHEPFHEHFKYIENEMYRGNFENSILQLREFQSMLGLYKGGRGRYFRNGDPFSVYSVSFIESVLRLSALSVDHDFDQYLWEHFVGIQDKHKSVEMFLKILIYTDLNSEEETEFVERGLERLTHLLF